MVLNNIDLNLLNIIFQIKKNSYFNVLSHRVPYEYWLHVQVYEVENETSVHVALLRHGADAHAE